MPDLFVYGSGLAAALVLGICGWGASVIARDVSIVDALWSLFFLLMGLVYMLLIPETGPRALLVFVLLTLWAVRLSLHISRRNQGQGEDRRYRAIRADNDPGFWWKSLYLVFGLQAILAWVISLPLLGAMALPAPLGWLDALALALWCLGFAFEALADRQLAVFKAAPENAGQVMDRGLWRYSRHPNYFGEACIWWAFYLFALAAGAWWALIAPLLMTILLLRVSGVALLERDIGERRPGYRDYVARTNAFIPGPPRRAPAGGGDGR
ncbi:membrane protein [Marichromatium purpuratum 984]|uniref:Membrane protein n=1 Tax=Marichromatium purpuratum 984 TaxID=765910 RepID=W0E7F4_MARPU|nr:DUF1295 domain-containing protein [Marichromatium purpuratum]AHF05001.1 membrane protein [Marichromatium purpuratum 984]